MTTTATTAKEQRRANGEAHQRRDGRWETAVYDASRGKWRSIYGRTKKEAQNKARAERTKLESGMALTGPTMKVGALLDLYLRVGLPGRTRVKSPNTVSNYKWAAGLARPVIGHEQVTALKVEDVELLLTTLADRGMSRSSVDRVRMNLVTVLRWAQRRKMVGENVAEFAEMPPNARPTKEGRSLTLDQAKALLGVAEGHRLGALVTVGVMLGLRPGELCGLRWVDVELDAAVLHVRQARKHHRGADGVGIVTFGEPKTKKSTRSIELPPEVVAALRQHSRSQAAERLRAGARWVDLDLVFATSIGTAMNPSNLRRDMAEMTVKAGIGTWTPKELRHSAGSLLSAWGVPLERIADLLGHVDTRMLERVYRHPVKATVDAAVGPMSAMFAARGA